VAVCAWLTVAVGDHIFGEDAEAAAHQADRAIGVPTGASPRYLVESSLESGGKSRVYTSSGQAGHIFGDGREPKNARPALPCALVSQISDDSR
jgi:hypothetical protein